MFKIDLVNFDFIQSLKVMLSGMVCIFIVIGVIIGGVFLLNAITGKRKK